MSAARAAAVALVVLGASGCLSSGPPTFTYRGGAARNPAPAPALAGPFVRFLHIADFGDATRQQEAVAAAIARAHRSAPFDAAFAAGDLVYECGPDTGYPGADACRFSPDGNTVDPAFTAPADPSFAVHDAPLAVLAERTATPVYTALGNHDVASVGLCFARDGVATSRLKACLSVAHRSAAWEMPGRHYVVDHGPARLIVVDSNLVRGDYGGFSFEDEVLFVARQAAGCRERRCFLVAHHPPVTAGSHADEATADYVARMERLIAAGEGRIAAVLAGHDHDLQHLRTPSGLDVFVSGNTSRGRERERFRTVSVAGTALLFASVRWGYGVLEVSDAGWRYRFEVSDGSGAAYCCTAVGTGRCEPSTCG